MFELFVRRLPANREFLIAAGLQQAVEYLAESAIHTASRSTICARFRSSSGAARVLGLSSCTFRFTGDVFAMPEGTPFFAGEPIAIVRRANHRGPDSGDVPAVDARLPVDDRVKGVRVVSAAQGRSVVEFGSRRAHAPEAGVLAARAAYIGGCTGTSNVEAGFRYGIPVFGTSAHSWVSILSPERMKPFERCRNCSDRARST